MVYKRLHCCLFYTSGFGCSKNISSAEYQPTTMKSKNSFPGSICIKIDIKKKLHYLPIYGFQVFMSNKGILPKNPLSIQKWNWINPQLRWESSWTFAIQYEISEVQHNSSSLQHCTDPKTVTTAYKPYVTTTAAGHACTSGRLLIHSKNLLLFEF